MNIPVEEKFLTICLAILAQHRSNTSRRISFDSKHMHASRGKKVTLILNFNSHCNTSENYDTKYFFYVVLRN